MVGVGDSTISIQPEESRNMIQKKVADTLKGDTRSCIWKHPGSFVLRIRYIKQQSAYRASQYNGATLIDAKTVQFDTDNYDEIMRFYAVYCIVGFPFQPVENFYYQFMVQMNYFQ